MQSDLFADANLLVVHHAQGMGAVMLGFSACSRFSVDFGAQAGMLSAEEQPNGWMRFFLGSMRTYTLVVQQRGGKPLLRLRSPWVLWSRRMEVTAADGKPLGTVRKGHAFARTRYDVLDARDRRVFTITGGLVKAWTFGVRRDGAAEDAAVIRKRRATVTANRLESSDRYELDFAAIHSPVERALLLGALFLIEFQQFGSGSGD